ncbi:MAG: hypothetical protein QNK03_04120 [Myxococcota bacterium]|nr:hypothetical protein [Myxococcota bacterium]
MSRLRLYTAFHANLDFSALPPCDVPVVLDRCYWPLLGLAADDGLRLGIELSSRTLARLEREDPEWSKALRNLAEQGQVEVIGSGLAQVVAPLAPADVNRANLALGRVDYERLLGWAPTTWFAHEQTFSRGLPALVREVGASAFVMEWNNPATAVPALRALRHRPARVAAGADALALLWNDSAVFQKLQRAAHGSIPQQEYASYVLRVHEASETRLLCAYGGDLEIFDHRPGLPSPRGGARGVEMARLRACLRELAADPRCELRLPRRVLEGLEPGPVVELASARDPLPCKKQPRYNPTRWAVSGRDGLGINTRCYRLRQGVRAAQALGAPCPAADRALVELWRSDLRTRATEEKAEAFHEDAARLAAETADALQRVAPALADGDDAVLSNCWSEPWEGEPVELALSFPPGRLRHGRALADGAAAQLEVHGRHRDGSIRSATLVVAPDLAPGERLRLRVVPEPPPRAPGAHETDAVVTDSVAASFLAHRGGALGALRFPGLSAEPLAGTVPHGAFDHVAYSPDFYSAHAVAVTERGEKVTDLSPVAQASVLHAGPLRTVLRFETETALGRWGKTYRVYRDRPRVDLLQDVRLREVRLQSLRVGTITWLAAAYRRRDLGFATVNGGDAIERFPLPAGALVEQQRPAAPSVSATSCLGATEGWVSAGDERLGLAVIGSRARAACVPLVEFADVDESFLLRIHHSAAETDDARATFFRGTRRFAFALVGHAASVEGARRTALAGERGLVFRTERDVGIATGL